MTAVLPQLAVNCFLIYPNAKPRPRIDPNNPPSITSQTPYLCDYFYFNRSTLPPKIGTDYFNCGFVTRKDGDWLMVRRSRAVNGLPFGMNDIVAFKLLDGTIPTDAHPLAIRAFYGNEHFEDPRAIYHEGKTYVSCCNFIWAPRNSGAHQIMCEFDDNWQLVKRYDPVYGGNGAHCFANKRQEKNWLWVCISDKPHLVYSANPHTVVEFDWDFKSKRQYIIQSNMKWTWGEMRGGTPPLKVGDEFFTFFHSSVEWHSGGGRRYYMGCYGFESKPPFKPTRYTSEPLLIGSREDVWSNGKPSVVFPSGSTLRHGEWFVTLGVNDLACAYICIDHSSLEKLMIPC